MQSEEKKNSDEIELLIKHIVPMIDPDKIILFGSRAKKQNNLASDYDICILKREIAHRRKLAQFIYRNITGIGLAVDIVVETPERFEMLKDNPYGIYYDIAREGVVIFDRSSNGRRVVETGKKQFGTGS